MLRYVLISLDDDYRELMRFISMDKSQTEHVVEACNQILLLPLGSLVMKPVPKRPQTFGVKLDEVLACQITESAKRYKVSARVFYYNALIRYISMFIEENEYKERAERLLDLIYARTQNSEQEGTQGGPTVC